MQQALYDKATDKIHLSSATDPFRTVCGILALSPFEGLATARPCEKCFGSEDMWTVLERHGTSINGAQHQRRHALTEV